MFFADLPELLRNHHPQFAHFLEPFPREDFPFPVILPEKKVKNQPYDRKYNEYQNPGYSPIGRSFFKNNNQCDGNRGYQENS
jgi:hypothetical protein